MSKWIRFDEVAEVAPGRRTVVWRVVNKETNAYLGAVRWYGPFRQYSFEPEPFTVFERTCLRDIADFCEARTRERTRRASE